MKILLLITISFTSFGYIAQKNCIEINDSIVSFEIDNKNKIIVFSKITNIELYDNYGNLILKSNMQLLNLAMYEKGLYYINFSSYKGLTLNLKKKSIYFLHPRGSMFWNCKK